MIYSSDKNNKHFCYIILTYYTIIINPKISFVFFAKKIRAFLSISENYSFKKLFFVFIVDIEIAKYYNECV